MSTGQFIVSIVSLVDIFQFLTSLFPSKCEYPKKKKVFFSSSSHYKMMIDFSTDIFINLHSNLFKQSVKVFMTHFRVGVITKMRRKQNKKNNTISILFGSLKSVVTPESMRVSYYDCMQFPICSSMYYIL